MLQIRATWVRYFWFEREGEGERGPGGRGRKRVKEMTRQRGRKEETNKKEEVTKRTKSPPQSHRSPDLQHGIYNGIDKWQLPSFVFFETTKFS